MVRVILIENIRFFKEETEDDQNFSKKLGELGDIYINDAFSCSHRKQSSIHNITKFINKINIIRRIFVQDFNRRFFE